MFAKTDGFIAHRLSYSHDTSEAVSRGLFTLPAAPAWRFPRTNIRAVEICQIGTMIPRLT